MTDEEIIEMAHQAGITYVTGHGVASATFEWLQKFADLVAAREREACAQMCEDQDTGQDLPYDLAVIECAKSIRARGEK